MYVLHVHHKRLFCRNSVLEFVLTSLVAVLIFLKLTVLKQ